MHVDEASEITEEDVEGAMAGKEMHGAFCAHLAADALYFAILNYALSANS
jgi:hypothetical protein